MPKLASSKHPVLAVVMAVVLGGCGVSGEDAPAAAAPFAEATTTASTTSTTIPRTTTSTTLRYGLYGEEMAVSESVLGTVTWWRVLSVPLELVMEDHFPAPSHGWDYRLPALYENAQTVTGACFEIYEEGAGYLGLGPCPKTWALREHDESGWDVPGDWAADFSKWLWLAEVWSSPDGESWDRATDAFPDPGAAVEAQPWSVAERDGRWVVIGATGVTEDADIVPVEWDWSDILGLRVRRSVQPAAWVSNDLATWSPLPVDFSESGTNTHLTSVVAGEAGWAIFGIRSSQERPWLAEWVAWASTDGSTWEELPMTGVYDAPCKPALAEHCGMIKAHMIDDAIVVYAWTWPVPNQWWEGAEWRLLIGEL